MHTKTAPIAVRARLNDLSARRAVAAMLWLWGARSEVAAPASPAPAPPASLAPAPPVVAAHKLPPRRLVAASEATSPVGAPFVFVPAATPYRDLLTLTCNGCGMPIHARVAAAAANPVCGCQERSISIKPVPIPALHDLGVVVVNVWTGEKMQQIRIYS